MYIISTQTRELNEFIKDGLYFLKIIFDSNNSVAKIWVLIYNGINPK
jgi:hypothetical protein